MTAVDRTALTEHLARRLRADGALHPVAGAVAIAARGSRRLAIADFAANLDLPVEQVTAAEAGQTKFAAIPAPVGAIAASTGIDLLSLADLERRWRAAGESAAAN